MTTIKYGLPQGSILCPFLFLIQINDLSSISSFFSAILFADNTTLFYSSPNLTQYHTYQCSNFTKCDRLYVNVDKADFIKFTPKGISKEHTDVHINGIEIRWVSKAKCLGVLIYNKLFRVEHICYISRKNIIICKNYHKSMQVIW